MRVFISADIEGVTGTTAWDETEIGRPGYEAACKQMTAEVVREVKADKSGMRCPVCGRGTIIRGKTRYGCSRWREGCTYAESF